MKEIHFYGRRAEWMMIKEIYTILYSSPFSTMRFLLFFLPPHVCPGQEIQSSGIFFLSFWRASEMEIARIPFATLSTDLIGLDQPQHKTKIYMLAREKAKKSPSNRLKRVGLLRSSPFFFGLRKIFFVLRMLYIFKKRSPTYTNIIQKAETRRIFFLHEISKMPFRFEKKTTWKRRKRKNRSPQHQYQRFLLFLAFPPPIAFQVVQESLWNLPEKHRHMRPWKGL